jgi:hypothetical protein
MTPFGLVVESEGGVMADNESPEERLREAEAERAKARRALERGAANLEALSRARTRIQALIDRLEEDEESEAQKTLLASLRADSKEFAERIELAREEQKKSQTALERLGTLIQRLRQRLKGGKVVMFDAVDVDQIPADAKAVGCYVGPSTVTCPEVSRKFPNARKVRITQAGITSTPADCVDVEPGDATNETGTTWVKGQLSAGVKRPIVYTSASNVNALLHTLQAAGVSRSQVRVWSAHYDQGEHICSPSVCRFPESDATQWTNHALGRDLDQSLCFGRFFS